MIRITFFVPCRHLIRCSSYEEYQMELGNIITRWSRPFVDYWIKHIQPDINKFGAWSMKSMDFPMTESSVLTSNNCEAMNRINKEVQGWEELPVDRAVLISRDIQRAKCCEVARAMMGLGNFEMLPEFKRKYSVKDGEDLLRRIGSAPSMDEILNRHKVVRNTSRHAGYRESIPRHQEKQTQSDEGNVILGAEQVPVEDLQIEIVDTPFNSVVVDTDNQQGHNHSRELQEVMEEFDLDKSLEEPSQELENNHGVVENETDGVLPTVVENILHSPPGPYQELASESVVNEVAFPSNAIVSTSFEENLDEIIHIPALDAYFSPGRLHPISVQLKKNMCSLCGYCPRRKWCVHLKRAALKAGLNVSCHTPKLKNLSSLRKNQRADKTKSGKKAPRTFDIVPLEKELNSENERQEILEEFSKTIQLSEPRNSKRKIRFLDEEESDDEFSTPFQQQPVTEPVQSKRKRPFEDSLDMDLILSETEDEKTTTVISEPPAARKKMFSFVDDKSVTQISDNIPPKRRRQKVNRMLGFNINLLPNK